MNSDKALCCFVQYTVAVYMVRDFQRSSSNDADYEQTVGSLTGILVRFTAYTLDRNYITHLCMELSSPSITCRPLPSVQPNLFPRFPRAVSRTGSAASPWL